MHTLPPATPDESRFARHLTLLRAARRARALIIGLSAVVSAVSAWAQSTAMTYQGRLVESGQAATGIYDFQFTLYDAASNGTPVGVTVTNDDVGVTNGLFTATLDFGSGVFTGSDRWLAISVRTGTNTGSFTALSPRQALTPVPYAQYALTPAGPQGPQGMPGPMGPQGPTGVSGVDGPTGPMGPQGPTGVSGMDGPTGPMGPQGPTGVSGMDGPTGPMGPQGPTGVSGMDGPTGPMGPQGPAGTTGQSGSSVFGTAGLNVTNNAFYTIPGLTQTITVPANGLVYVTTDGGVVTTSTATNGYSQVNVAVFIDGVSPPTGAWAHIIVQNAGAGVPTSARWAISYVPTLAAGVHTVDVRASLSGGSTAIVSGNSSSVHQGELTALLLNK